MPDWKICGYVPDSDDEDDDLFNLSRDLILRDEAAIDHDRLVEAAEPGIDHNVTINTSILPPFSEPANRSTADRLSRSIKDGLDLVRGVLVAASSQDLQEDDMLDSPLSSLPSSVANSPQRPRSSQLHSRILLEFNDGVPQVAPRRSLRARAPIQEHPYALEDAKYRQLMKDRGLKPVNAPVVVSHPRTGQSAEESQQTEPFQSSQALESFDFDVPSSPTSSLPAASELDTQYAMIDLDVLEDNFDDGLPDLSQLIRQRNPFSRKTLKVKNTVDDKSPGRHSTLDNSLFRVPPSPPHSDDFGIVDDEEEDIVSTFRRTKRPDTPTALPTPLISSEPGSRKRPVTVLTSDELSRSTDDDRLSFSPAVDDDDDDSQGFRIVKNRLRGVLPPSFLRLDLQEQTRAKTKSLQLRSPVASERDRGVARRTKTKGGQSSKNFKDVLQLSDSESDSGPDPEDHMRQSSIVETRPPDPTFSAVVDLADDDTMMDYVSEDQIDPMLPPVGRRRSRTKSRIPRQRRLDDGWAVRSRRSAADAVAVGLVGKQVLISRTKSGTTNKAKRRKTRHRWRPLEMKVCHAPGLCNLEKKDQPRFLRVAARQARGTNRYQAQSPSKKFFVFATREETQEVNDQVKTWRDSYGGVGKARLVAGANVFKTTTTRAADQSARPTLQTSTDSTRGLHSSDLNSLKLSTDALLSKLVVHDTTSLERTTVSEVIPASTRLSKESKRADIDYLRTLFTRHNRSGQGHFLVRASEPRPAQVEMNRPSFVPTVTLPVRSLGKASVASKDPSARPVLKANTETQHDKIDRPVVQRRSKKQIPKRSSIPAATMESTNNSPLLEVADNQTHPGLYHAEATELNITTTETEQWTSVAVSAVRDLNLLAKGASFSSNSLLSTRVLKDIQESYQNTSYDPTQPKRCTRVITTPLSIRTRSCGLYDDSISELIISVLAEVQCSFFGPNEDAVKQPEHHKKCVQSVASVVDYFINAAFFVDTDRMSAVETLTNLSQGFHLYMTEFLQNWLEREFDFDSDQRSSILECLNGFALLAFYLHIVLDQLNVPLTVRLRNMTTRILAALLEMILEPYALTRSLNRLYSVCGEFPQHLIDVDEPFPEAESLVVVWHISQMMSADMSTSRFFDLVADAFPAEKASDLSSHLAIYLMALCFILPLTQVKIEGETFMDPSEFALPDFSCFETLTKRLQDLVTNVQSGHAHPSASALLEAVEDVCLKTTKIWGWQVDPSVVSALFRTYTWNAMLPFNTAPNLEVTFGELEDPFDIISHQANNDFFKFLELVELCMKSLGRLGSVAGKEYQLPAPSKVRAFVFSLIPNNARNCGAGEDLGAHQFLALKNHFSLYVTLFKCAPEGSKPRFTQLEQQVDFSISHQRVCELAIVTWKTVSLHYVQQVSPSDSNLSDISIWMNTMLRQSIQCFGYGNHAQANIVLNQLLSALTTVVNGCTVEPKARALLQGALLRSTDQLLNDLELLYRNQQVIIASLRVIDAYILTALATPIPGTLTMEILSIMKVMVKQTLSPVTLKNHDTLSQLAKTWFNVAKSSIREKRKSWDDFVIPQSDFSLDFLSGFRGDYVVHEMKQLFFCQLVKAEPAVYSLDHRLSVLQTWIVAVLQPLKDMSVENHLTDCILKHERESLKIKDLAARIHLSQHDGKEFTLQRLEDSRLVILRHVIQNIYEQQDDPEEEWLAGGLDAIARRQLLRTMLVTMKKNWKKLGADAVAQRDYTFIVHTVLNELETYSVAGVSIDQWFYNADEFPRPQQTLDNIFKCRFGETAGEITKDAISSFRSFYIQALHRHEAPSLLEDLFRVFNCTDLSRSRQRDGNTQYSIDFKKQNKFIQIVFPAYVELGSLTMDCNIFDPIIELLTGIARRIQFRIDNLNSANMRNFMIVTTTMLCAVRAAIEKTQLEHNSTPALLRYVRVATKAIFSLAEYGIELDEAAHEMTIGNILGIYNTVFCKLDAEENTSQTTWPDPDDRDINHGRVDTKNTVYDAWTSDIPAEDFDLVPGQVPSPPDHTGVRALGFELLPSVAEPELAEAEKELRNFAWQDLRRWEGVKGEGEFRHEEVRREMVALVEELRERVFLVEEEEEEEW